MSVFFQSFYLKYPHIYPISKTPVPSSISNLILGIGICKTTYFQNQVVSWLLEQRGDQLVMKTLYIIRMVLAHLTRNGHDSKRDFTQDAFLGSKTYKAQQNRQNAVSQDAFWSIKMNF